MAALLPDRPALHWHILYVLSESVCFAAHPILFRRLEHSFNSS